jgi:AraC-like DNA-binding protein
MPVISLFRIVKAAAVFDVQAAFLEGAGSVAEEVRRLLIGRHEKPIARARQMVDRRLKQARPGHTVSPAEAARALDLSAGRLSRMFRRANGATFCDYVLTRRMEYARRLPLDPPNNFSLVSERRGLSAPAYFARVFRKAAGCAPAEHASNPRRVVAPGGGPNGRNGNHGREIVEFRR